MAALSKTRSDGTGRQSGWLVPFHPVAWLAFAVLLSIAWTGTLALCAYNAICWLIG